MAKQLNVNLAFTANTAQARAELNKLQTDLMKLTQTTTLTSGASKLTADIQSATRAAAQLSVQLKNAVNPNTGNLDLSRFNDSLKASGMSLDKYAVQLNKLGPAGQQAFASLTNSIMKAEMPLARTNTLFNQMWTVMKNTARWQLSSSMLHSFIMTVRGAFTYVKDLNESLNNIRIVTGQSTEEMSRFAAEANKAAKALNATTVQYTNAALIYYQQGLSAKEVIERTNTTIKMANVSRQSAEVVSDQMTAIWNNFDNGSKSLEYYGDVITALGAKTASSSEEIATGLEKFAAVSETVGLSYEYATSALATVTATTRQSADTVGTAFKTLFARIQGLSLGETLDDGTTLNKYSEALNKVGINIKDQGGQLKDMDLILDELGSKWEKLNQDQQVALAQTVAGVRQYTQLIALMDNWDFFKENLQTAYTSEGTLSQQAEIYAESWRAASDQVKASAESIYEALLNDDFFIDLNKGFAKVLDGVKVFIDGVGGVKNIILGLGAIVTKVFATKITTSINDAIYTLKNFGKSGVEASTGLKTKAANLLSSAFDSQGKTFEGSVYKDLSANQLLYVQNVQNMTAEEQALNQILLDRQQIMGQLAIQSQADLEKEQEKTNLQIQRQLYQTRRESGGIKSDSGISMPDLKGMTTDGLQAISIFQRLSTVATNVGKNSTGGFKTLQNDLQDTINKAFNLDINLRKLHDNKNNEQSTLLETLQTQLKMSKTDAEELIKTLSHLGSTKEKSVTNTLSGLMGGDIVSGMIDKKTASFRDSLVKAFPNADSPTINNLVGTYTRGLEEIATKSDETAKSVLKVGQAHSATQKSLQGGFGPPIQPSYITALTAASSNMMSYGMAINSVKNIINSFSDENASLGDQLLSLAMGFGMLIPAIMGTVKQINTYKIGLNQMASAAEKAASAQALLNIKLTIIIAAIALVSVGFYKLATMETDLEKSAKEAAAAHKELKDKVQETKDELDNIKSAFEAYDTAVEALEQCAKGTQEWKDALAAVTQEILNILALNPQLAGMIQFEYDSNGNRFISNQQEILDHYQTQANLTNYASLSQSGKSSYADWRLNLESSIDSLWTSHTQKGYVASSGEQTGKLKSWLSEDWESIMTMPITEITETVTSIFGKGTDSEVINDYVNAILEQRNVFSDIGNQIKNSNRIIADNELGDEYGVFAKNIAAAQAQQAYESGDDQWGRFGRWANQNNANAKELFDAYLIATDQVGKYTNFKVNKNKETGTMEFAFGSGEDKQTISVEAMKSIVASANALDGLTASADKAAAYFEGLSSEKAVDFANNVSEAIGLDGEINYSNIAEDYTIDQLKSFESDIFNDTYNSLKTDLEKDGLSEEDQKQLDKQLTENLSSVLGVTVEELSGLLSILGVSVTDFAEGLVGAAGTVQEISDTTRLHLGGIIDTTGMSVSEITQYSNRRKTAGENLVETSDNKLNYYNLTDIEKENKEKTEELSEFFGEIGSMDLQAEDAAESIRALANELGLTGPAIDKLINGVAELPTIFTNDVKEIQTKAGDLSNVVKDLALGEIVSAEDLQKLQDAGIDLTDYFSIMSDGQGKMIGDASQLKAIVDSIIFKDYQGELNNFTEAANQSGYQEGNYLSEEAIANEDGTQAALQYVNSLQGFLSEKALGDLTSSGALSDEILSGTAGIPLQPEQINALNQALQELEVTQGSLQSSLAASATSFNEFSTKAKQAGLDVNSPEYMDALKSMATGNEKAAGALKKYNDILDTYGKESQQARDATREFEKALKKIEVNEAAKEIRTLLKELSTLTDENEKLNNYAKIADQLEKAFGNKVTTDFIANHDKLINNYVNGSDEVRAAAAGELQILTAVDDVIAGGSEYVINLDDSELSGLQGKMGEIKALVESNPALFTINSAADLSAIANEFAGLQISGLQLAALLASIGQTTIDFQSPEFGPLPELTDGNVEEWLSAFTSSMNNMGLSVSDFSVPEAAAPEMTSGGGGGGGGGSKAPERKKASSDDRYKEITDKIDNNTEAMTDLNRELDSAYGAGRVAAMGKVLAKMEEEEKLIRQKIALVEKYRDIDKNNLMTTMKGKVDVEYDSLADFGVSDFVIDPKTGDISNWTSVWDEFYAKRDALMDEYESKDTTPQRKKELEEIIAKMDEFEEKLREDGEQYIETVELHEEELQKLKDQIVAQMEQRYDEWKEGLDYQAELNDAALDRLERTLNQFSNSFFARAEKLTIMNKVTSVYDKADTEELQGRFDDLQEKFTTDKDGDGNVDITQADYVDGMKAIEEYANNAIDELYDYTDELSVYYKETVEQSMEILEGVTGQFETMRSVLDHYVNIYEILEGTMDYDKQLEVLGAQKESLYAEADAWGQAFKMYSKELQEKEEDFEEASKLFATQTETFNEAQSKYDQGLITEEEYEKAKTLYSLQSKTYEKAKNDYEAALVAAQGSEEKMLAAAEQYAQTIRDIFTTELKKYGKELEEATVKSLDMYSFDQLTESMEQAKSLTEDWLTETNKVYETNKLINKAQGELEKTTNSLAKKRLKSFIDETEALQKQNKLSKFELEVQEAKYNLALAEIALEEAKNAKSVVRMQRDSEGNYGYVYTADSDAVNEAEQQYADAENELYNIRLEGANEFGEKKIQAEKELQEKLTELDDLFYNQKAISEKEYNARREALLEAHEEKILEYSRLYRVATMEDTRIVAESWASKYEKMILDTESWSKNVENYKNNVVQSHTNLKDETQKLNLLINQSTGGTAKTIEELLNGALSRAKEKTSELHDQITDPSTGLLKAFQDEIDKVDELSGEYMNKLIPSLDTVIEKYKELAWNAGKEWVTASGTEPPPIEAFSYDTKADYAQIANDAYVKGDMEAFEDALKKRQKKIDDLGITPDVTNDQIREYLEANPEGLAEGMTFQKALYPQSEDDVKISNIDEVIKDNHKGNKNFDDSNIDTGSDKKKETSDIKDKINYYKHAYNIIDPQGNIYHQVNGTFDTLEEAQAAVKSTLEGLGEYRPYKYSYDIQLNGDQQILTTTRDGVIYSQKAFNSAKEVLDYQDRLPKYKWYTYEDLGYTVDYYQKYINDTLGAGEKYQQFNTGGYTGSWGPEGKLAMLHQKELILNADDTVNMLQTISLVRDIIKRIDLEASMSALRSSYQLESMQYQNFIGNTQGTLEQQVTIEANFPSVSDRNEIEAAFESLVNRASQFANRKKL